MKPSPPCPRPPAATETVKSEIALQDRGRRPDTNGMVAPNGSEDEATAPRPVDRCDATIRVRDHGELTCEKEADHDGPHEAEMKGRWERVIWGD